MKIWIDRKQIPTKDYIWATNIDDVKRLISAAIYISEGLYRQLLIHTWPTYTSELDIVQIQNQIRNIEITSIDINLYDKEYGDFMDWIGDSYKDIITVH